MNERKCVSTLAVETTDKLLISVFALVCQYDNNTSMSKVFLCDSKTSFIINFQNVEEHISTSA